MMKGKIVSSMMLIGGLLMSGRGLIFGNPVEKDIDLIVLESEDQEIVSDQIPWNQMQIVHEFSYGIGEGELGIGIDVGPRRLFVHEGCFYILDECNYRIVIYDGEDTVEIPLKEAEILQDMYVDTDGITVLYAHGNVVTYADPVASNKGKFLDADLESIKAIEVARYNIGNDECHLGNVWSNKILQQYRETEVANISNNIDATGMGFVIRENYKNEEKNLEMLINEIYTSLLRIDVDGNRYYRGTAIISMDSDMLIETSVWKIAPNGDVVGSVVINTELMAYFPLEYVAVDTDGTIYVLECRNDKAVIEQYYLGTNLKSELTNKCIEYKTTIDKKDSDENAKNIDATTTNALITSKTRAAVINTASLYESYKWTVTADNLYPVEGAAPAYLETALTGVTSAMVTGIPYCFGRSDSIATFNTNRANGYYTGYRKTDKRQERTTGVDCSGYVAQCYGNTYYGTSEMLSFYATITQSQLCKGDFILGRTSWGASSNHVRLFYQVDSDGTWIIYESTNAPGYDRVIKRGYNVSTFAVGYKYGTAWETGHQYTYKYTDAVHWLYCSNGCNLTQQNQSHSINKYTVYNSSAHKASCGVCGYYIMGSHSWIYSTSGSVKLRTCSACGYSESY